MTIFIKTTTTILLGAIGLALLLSTPANAQIFTESDMSAEKELKAVIIQGIITCYKDVTSFYQNLPNPTGSYEEVSYTYFSPMWKEADCDSMVVVFNGAFTASFLEKRKVRGTVAKLNKVIESNISPRTWKARAISNHPEIQIKLDLIAEEKRIANSGGERVEFKRPTPEPSELVLPHQKGVDDITRISEDKYICKNNVIANSGFGQLVLNDNNYKIIRQQYIELGDGLENCENTFLAEEKALPLVEYTFDEYRLLAQNDNAREIAYMKSQAHIDMTHYASLFDELERRRTERKQVIVNEAFKEVLSIFK